MYLKEKPSEINTFIYKNKQLMIKVNLDYFYYIYHKYSND